DADIQVGDLLVSSGFDGIFPAGYPVATVTTVRRNPAETFATVEAKPLALLDRDREVLLLWPNTPRGAASRDASMTDTAAEPSLANPPEHQSPAPPPAGQRRSCNARRCRNKPMPVPDERIRPARVVVTALVALMFAITQLPDVIEKARPELLLLLVI